MPFDADTYWYSSIELSPGEMTRSGELPYWTMSLSREALDGIDVTGMKCLDVGAADGFTAAMLKRRGAKSVVAIDCCDYSRQNAIVQDALGVGYKYLPGVGTLKLVDRLIDFHKFGDRLFTDHGRADTDFAYDLVVCSGVMYHVYSPVHLIGSLRTLVRPGGIVVLETAFIPGDGHYMSFNYFGAGNHIYTYSDTWFITPHLLDYLLRMFSLEPIDFIYRTDKQIDGDRFVGRGAVVCRAVDAPIPKSDQHQMATSTRTFEFDELYKVELEALKQHSNATYGSVNNRGVFRDGFLDLAATADAQADLPKDHDRAVLRLADYQ